MRTLLKLTGATVLAPDGRLEPGDVHVADGRIVAGYGGGAEIDCRGLHVLPGVVDVHGDAFELELHPRPGVDMPFGMAMASVDRQLLANGITTAYHGLTVSWEPGARSLAAARTFMRELDRMRGRLTADHRVQLRWETFAFDAIEDIAVWLAAPEPPALAFNDHTTMTVEMLARGDQGKLLKWAQRAGVSLEDYLALAEGVAGNAARMPEAVGTVARMARDAGAVMLSHDDRDAAARRAFRALGAAISEFPLSRSAAAEARARGEHVVMGAPNVIRGGSHASGMSAEDAVRDGLCTVLATDYYYPGPMNAARMLVGRGALALSDAWNLISASAAASMGLTDRGAIAPGMRADLVVVDIDDGWRIRHVIAGGAVSSFA